MTSRQRDGQSVGHTKGKSEVTDFKLFRIPEKVLKNLNLLLPAITTKIL